MKKYPYKIALINFFVAACLGLLLRLSSILKIDFLNFAYILHTHSHIALLGWCYLALYLFLIQAYAPTTATAERYYRRLFWLSQFAVLGMLISFPLQGYAAVSITFATLHILCSYAFGIALWRSNTAHTKLESLFLKSSLAFMLLSTIGIWCLGPAINLQGKSGVFYKLAIQFYLHFQFNGWLIFGVLTLLLKKQFPISSTKKNYCAFLLLLLATLLTFALPLSWHLPHPSLPYINACAVFLQLLAFYLFFKEARLIGKSALVAQHTTQKILGYFALFSLALRILMQITSIFDSIASASYALRQWTIGFIHLNMLGIITGYLLWLFWQHKIIPNSKLANCSVWLFLVCFTLTELLLFTDGLLVFLALPLLKSSYQLLGYFSIGFPLGILGILTASLCDKPSK